MAVQNEAPLLKVHLMTAGRNVRHIACSGLPELCRKEIHMQAGLGGVGGGGSQWMIPSW